MAKKSSAKPKAKAKEPADGSFPGKWNGKLDTSACDGADGSLAGSEAIPEPFPTETIRKPRSGNGETDAGTTGATQTTTIETENEAGDVRFSVAETAGDYSVGGLAREETRAQASNRWVLEGRRWEADTFRKDVIRQCRSAGMTREQASEHAWKACMAKFPPHGVAPSVIESDPEPVSQAETIRPEPVAVSPAPPKDDGSVSGLADLPPGWPELPANAQLQVEIAWVTANRLRVRDGSGVNLSKALSPAPSYSALSWLETSILFPAKFADISVKATAQQDDEREFIRREKMAIEEIRGILGEMLEAKD